MKIVLIVAGAVAGALAVVFLAGLYCSCRGYRMYESIGRNDRDVMLWKML